MRRHGYLVFGVILLLLASGVLFLREALRWSQLPPAYQERNALRGMGPSVGMGGGMGMGQGMGRGMGPMRARRPASFRSNGERIYFTGIDDQGKPITVEGGPPWLATHGGSCVDCHGPHGRGGVPVMMGTAIPADMRYGVLTGKEHAAGEEHMDHPLYTDALIKRAITAGLDPAGKPLDSTMPRFTISERDLNALVDFLKHLDDKGNPG